MTLKNFGVKKIECLVIMYSGHVIALSSKQLAYNWNDVGSNPTVPTTF